MATNGLILLLCVGIFGFFLFLLLFLLLMRYLNYRENVKLAEQGFPIQQKPKRNRGFLIAGWVITVLGFISTLLLWLFGLLAFGEGRFYPLALGPWVLLGLIPLAFGLILLFVYVLLTPPMKKMMLDTPPESPVEPMVLPEEE